MTEKAKISPTSESQELGVLVMALTRELHRTLWGVVLFGSAARGESMEASDLDILIIADELPVKFTARMQLLRGVLPSEVRGKVSLIAKTRAEFEAGFPSYYLDLAVDGIILFDRDAYMKKRLERVRSLMQTAGLTRRRTDYGFLWQWRKPPTGHWRIDWSGVHGL